MSGLSSDAIDQYSDAKKSDIRGFYGIPNVQCRRIYINKLGWKDLEHWMKRLRPQVNP